MDLSPEKPGIEQPPSKSASCSSSADQYDLGVLFVHGIGQQRRGDTLTSFMDPLYRHLERMLTKDDHYAQRKELELSLGQEISEEDRNRYKALLRQLDRLSPLTFCSSALRELPNDPAAPARSILQVSAQAKDDSQRSVKQEYQTTWCVAESWWADEFDAPPFSTFFRWTIRIAPAIIILHFARSWYRSWQNDRMRLRYWWRLWGQAVILVFAAVPLSLLVSALLFLLLLLGLLPIPGLSGAVKRKGLALAESLGDSYILLESPVQFDAMVSRVSRDLDWLSRQCRTVAVVAHSQGAMISHHCLRRNRRSNLDLFVTVGSGLGKLHEIQGFRRWGTITGSWAFALSYFFCLGIPVILWLAGARIMGFLFGLLFVAQSLANLYMTVQSQLEIEVRRKEELWLKGAGKEFAWIDFWSSTDPVSNGPIFVEKPPWLQSHETWTRASILRDHSGYLHNVEGFLAPLACEFGKLVGGAVGANLVQQEARVLAAERKRRWRVGWLFVARYAAFSVAIFSAIRLWTDVEDDAAGGLSRMSPSRQEPIKDLTAWLDRVTYLSVEPEILTTLLLFTITIVLTYTLIPWLWTRWERRDVTQFYRSHDVDTRGWLFGAFTVHAVAVAFFLGMAGSTEAVTKYVSSYFYPFVIMLLTVCGGAYVLGGLVAEHRVNQPGQDQLRRSLQRVEDRNAYHYRCMGEVLVVSEAVLAVLCYLLRHPMRAISSKPDLTLVSTIFPALMAVFALALAWLVVRFVGSRLDRKVIGQRLGWWDALEDQPRAVITEMAPDSGQDHPRPRQTTPRSTD